MIQDLTLGIHDGTRFSYKSCTFSHVNDGMRFLAFLTAVVVCLAGECSPKVAPTTLRELTASSDLIVVGEVTRVTSIKGLRVAEVRVTTTIKGQSPSTIYYLAQPTWICDTTGATVGKETLFFFTKYRFDPQPTSMAYVKPIGGLGTRFRPQQCLDHEIAAVWAALSRDSAAN
jgi:hypothetical protein